METTKPPFKQVTFKRLNIKDVSGLLKKKRILQKKNPLESAASSLDPPATDAHVSLHEEFDERPVTSCVYLCALLLRLQNKKKKICWCRL